MKSKREPITLTSREAAYTIRLLRQAQACLEGFIDSVIIPGESEATNEQDAMAVRQDRRDWSAAEKLIHRLPGRPR